MDSGSGRTRLSGAGQFAKQRSPEIRNQLGGHGLILGFVPTNRQGRAILPLGPATFKRRYKMKNGKGAAGAANAKAPQTFRNALYGRSISHPVKIPHHKTCGHARATVRNVVEFEGAARYVCRECFSYLLRVEVREIRFDSVRREIARIFRILRPRLNRAGGAIRALAAILAPIGAEGGTTT